MSAATLRVEIDSAEQMHEFGKRLGEKLIVGDLVSLNGPLGAGKTTLTRGIGEGVGASGTISSPTFLIARQHPAKNCPFNHIDAYRLANPAELDDLDIDFAGAISVMEWGKGFAQQLVSNLIEISITADLQTQRRELEITGTGRFSNLQDLGLA